MREAYDLGRQPFLLPIELADLDFGSNRRMSDIDPRQRQHGHRRHDQCHHQPQDHPLPRRRGQDDLEIIVDDGARRGQRG